MEDKKAVSKTEALKALRAQKRAIADQEKAIKETLDADKENRKKAKRDVTRSKNEAEEKRGLVTKAVRKVNAVMLTKSIKNNAGEFEEALEGFQESASSFIDAANSHLEAIEELAKYE